MNDRYRLYHPKWHRRRIPIFWWLEKLCYTKFITRELTSLFVAYSALVLLVQTWAAGRGAEAYDRFLEWLARPAVVVLHALVLAAVLMHTITWLNLTPKALVLRLGGRRVPDAMVLLGHYAAWLGASAAIVWLVLGR